jgi:hypothetical protein
VPLAIGFRRCAATNHERKLWVQIGNNRDTAEAEAQKRLDAIRDLYDRQCAELSTVSASLFPYQVQLQRRIAKMVRQRGCDEIVYWPGGAIDL